MADRTDPRQCYESRLALRREAVRKHDERDNHLATARGLTFLVGLYFAWETLWSRDWALFWLLVPFAVFLGLIVFHQRVVRQLAQAKRTVRYYEQSLQRLNNQWKQQGITGERYQDPDHVYSQDLDLFGPGSLFHLICTSRTRLGEDTLANWLKQPAKTETIRNRQGAIEELREQVDLREAFAMLDAEVHDDLDQNQVLTWARETPRPVPPYLRKIAVVLTTGLLLALLAWIAGLPTGRSLFVGALMLQVVFIFTFRHEIKATMISTEKASSGLDILAQVLEKIEPLTFSSPYLRDILSRLETEHHPPSWHISRLHGLIEYLHNSLQNQFFAPIAFAVSLPVHLVHAIEMWRSKVGSHIAGWLESVGEFEALLSLAGYAFEHPTDPFPEIVSLEQGPVFQGVALGHPLLSEKKSIRNDLRVNGEPQLVLVSGSNMSGKSTLLRTVGTNAVLALAGAPVRAESLRISPVQIGTTMRIQDSLQDGESLFYAEISRLKSIVVLAGQELPLLFLFDEILQGTNSHDRRVGAEGILRNLVSQGAIGLVTTHDLDLTRMVDTLEPRAVNVHFEDHLEEGEMKFDYCLRPGVVQKSNALELMRMVGLEIENDPILNAREK